MLTITEPKKDKSMKKLSSKTLLKNNWIFYLITILAVLTMRHFSRITDSDALLWILAPTTRWAGILGGIPFEYLPHMGYVNHFYRFLIAPSCSGIRFMMITFLMLIFSFIHKFSSSRAKAFWFGISAVFSYLSTIFVNGIRITLAIYLPIPLEKAGLLTGLLNSDRLHTLIGTVVYFSALCVFYPLASCLCQYLSSLLSDKCADSFSSASEPESKLLIPAFWYLLAVLVIPFAGRMIRNDWDGFIPYALLISGACIIILAVSLLIRRLLPPHA